MSHLRKRSNDDEDFQPNSPPNKARRTNDDRKIPDEYVPEKNKEIAEILLDAAAKTKGTGQLNVKTDLDLSRTQCVVAAEKISHLSQPIHSAADVKKIPRIGPKTAELIEELAKEIDEREEPVGSRFRGYNEQNEDQEEYYNENNNNNNNINNNNNNNDNNSTAARNMRHMRRQRQRDRQDQQDQTEPDQSNPRRIVRQHQNQSNESKLQSSSNVNDQDEMILDELYELVDTLKDYGNGKNDLKQLSKERASKFANELEIICKYVENHENIRRELIQVIEEQ